MLQITADLEELRPLIAQIVDETLRAKERVRPQTSRRMSKSEDSTVLLMTSRQVMDALQITRRTVDRLVEDGTLESKRIGKNGRWVRITRESFDRYYESLS